MKILIKKLNLMKLEKSSRKKYKINIQFQIKWKKL